MGLLRAMLWGVLGLLGAAGVATVAAAVALLWLVSPAGRAFLAEERSFGPWPGGLSVEIAGFRHAGLDSLDLKRLRVADGEGTFLTARDLQLRWRPTDLLAGQLTVTRLRAGKLTLQRTPSLGGGTGGASAGAGPARPGPGPDRGGSPPVSADLPATLPFSISVQDLAVDRLVLAPGLAGTERVWNVRGNARVTRRLTAVTTSLAASPVQGRAGSGNLQLTVNPRRRHASLHLGWREPSGGPLAASLALGAAAPVKVDLTASGWLDGGEAELTLRAGESVALDAAASVGPADKRPGYRIDAQGKGRLFPLLRSRVPAALAHDLAPLADGPLTARTRLHLTPSFARLEVTELAVSAPAGTLSGQGRVDFGQGRVDGQLSLAAAEPAAYRRLVPGLTWDKLRLEASLSGPLARPEAALSLRAKAPRWHAWQGASLRADLRVVPTSELPGEAGLRASGTAVLAEPRVPFPRLQAGLGDRLKLALQSGRLTPDGAVAIKGLKAQSGTLQATAQGRYTIPDRHGRLQLDGRAASLAELADTLPPALRRRLDPSGRATVKATVEAQPATLVVDGHVRATQLSLGQPGLDRLVAQGLTLSATGAVDRAGLTLAQGRLALPGVSLTATAQGDLGFAAPRRVDAQLRLEARDLAVLRRAGRRQLGAQAQLPKLAGGVTARIAVDGPLAGPKVDITADGKALRLAGQPLPQSHVEATLAPPWSAPSGTIRASCRHAGQAYGLRTAWSADPAKRRVALTELVVRGLGGRLSGRLDAHLPADGPPELNGELTGQTDGLAKLAAPLPWLTGLQGSARARLALAPGESGQTAEFSLALSDLSYRRGAAGPPIHASELAVKGDLAGVFSTPTGTVEIAADNIVRKRIDLARLDVAVELAPELWKLSGSARGRAGRPFEVRGAGELRPAGAGLAGRLKAFSGRFGAERFQLAEPARAELRPGDIAIPSIRIEGEKGVITLTLKADETGLAGALSFRRMPLAILRLTGRRIPVSGRARGKIALSGSLAKPQGQVELRLTNLQATRTALAELPPAELRLNGKLAKETVSLTGTAFLPDAGALKISAETGLPLDPETLVPALRADQKVRVSTDGELHLAVLNDLLADRGIRLNGRIDMGLGVGGTLTEPELTGAATVRSAGVAIPRLGVAFSQIQGRIRGTGQRLELAELRARTPNDGTVRFDGGIALWGEAPGTGEITAQATEAALVSGDTVTAIADAQLRLQVSPAKGRLDGRVTIVRANYRIPDRLPAQVVALDVTEIPADANQVPLPPPPVPPRSNASASPAGETDAAPAAWPFTLDLAIRAPRRVFIRGRGLDLELSGDVRLAGPAAAPRLTGELSLVRGTMDLFGRRFVFDRGTVQFGQGQAIDPRLNLAATARVEGLDVTLTVGGTAAQPSLELSSQPPLPEQEILARVLCGGPLDECSAFQALTVANTLNTLRGGGLAFMEQLRRGLGVDRLRVSGGDTDAETGEQTAPTLGVGRYFGERVFVDVEQTLGESRDTRVNVEIEMTRNIRLQTRVDQDAASRVGINVEWDY